MDHLADGGVVVMPAHIPPGREHLWQRQAEADAEVARVEAEFKAAERKANDLARALDPDDSIVEDADAEVDRLWTETIRAQAVAERVWEERTAGLTSWIDENPTDPICPDCQGAGGPPGCDALGACGTCRGWGREYRPPIPVWHDAHSGKPAGWCDPATGHSVDLLADSSATQAKGVDVSTGATTGQSSSLWWLNGKDTSAMSFNEVSELAIRTGNLRDEMRSQGDPPEHIADVEREYQRLLEAQQAAGQRMEERRAARADEPPPPEGAGMNQAAAGVVEGVSTITPTGLATAGLSVATGKDIKSPLAAAATGGATPGGGTGVSHAEEGNAQIQQAGQDIEAAMGAIQEIVSNLETAQQNLTGAAEGSQHSEADTAMGALQEAVSAANDLQQQVGAAKQAVEDVRL